MTIGKHGQLSDTTPILPSTGRTTSNLLRPLILGANYAFDNLGISEGAGKWANGPSDKNA